MSRLTVKYAVVRPVPNSYDCCVRANAERIDVALAKKQHAKYCKALEELGLKLIWVKGDDSLPDSCFVEDTAIIIGEKAIICNMKVKSRAREVIEVAKVLEKLKGTHYIKPPATIDGGDMLKIENKIFVGLSGRTNLQAVQQLRKILNGCDVETVPVKIQNVLHLKSACTYLGDNHVILSMGHFDADMLRNYEKIVVPRGEEYAADCLAVNGTILMAKGYPKTKKMIEEAGFSVKELEMSEFRKGEGALTCLSIIF
ncbi:MAG: dimethylarginine dimethylaminohydrolase family protein [Candidatus Bathyarchaeales archaeon]